MNTFEQTCPHCQTAFKQSSDVSELHVFLAAPICNKIASKCPACYKTSYVYLSTEGVVIYMANLHLVPLIKNNASDNLKKHAIDARERSEKAKSEQTTTAVEIEVHELTPRMEDAIKTFSDEMAAFSGFPCTDISIITEAKNANLPIKWTD